MELGSMRFDYGTTKPEEKKNKSSKLAGYNPYQCGQRVFLIKTPRFMKKLFGEDFELAYLRKE